MIKWCSCGFLMCALLAVEGGYAQVWPELILDTPIDLEPGSTFGHTLDLNGSLLAVGAPGSGLGSTWPGAVYLYDRYEGGLEAWGLVQTLSAVVPYPSAGFGTHVRWHRDMLLVSAPGDVHPGTGLATGAVYVYQRDDPQVGEWGLRQVIYPPDLDDGLRFGDRILAEDDLLLVHAPGHDENPMDGSSGSGAIHVFLQSTAGTFLPDTLLTGDYLAPDASVRPRTSGWMTIFGDLFVYGSRAGDVYRLDRSALIDPGSLPPTPAKVPLSDTLGIQCTVLDFVGVAATQNHLLLDLQPFCTVEAKRVVAYELLGEDSLVQSAALMPDTSLGLLEWWGWGADLDTYMDIAVVGVRGDPIFTPNGHVEVFRPGSEPHQDWQRIAYLVQSDPGYGDQFGRAVAIWEDVVAVGAPFHGPLDRGKVYIYRDGTTEVLEGLGQHLGATVYPNPIIPGTTNLRIMGSVPEQGIFGIHTLDGRCIKQGYYVGHSIPWTTQAPGSYVLRVQAKDYAHILRSFRLFVQP